MEWVLLLDWSSHRTTVLGQRDIQKCLLDVCYPGDPIEPKAQQNSMNVLIQVRPHLQTLIKTWSIPRSGRSVEHRPYFGRAFVVPNDWMVREISERSSEADFRRSDEPTLAPQLYLLVI